MLTFGILDLWVDFKVSSFMICRFDSNLVWFGWGGVDYKWLSKVEHGGCWMFFSEFFRKKTWKIY